MSASKRTLLGITALLAGGLLLLTAVPALAGEPHIGQVVVTDSDNGKDSLESFATDTAKIFVHAQLVEMADGTKVGAAWIAEKTEVAPPNFRIDGSELTVASTDNVANFSLSKPNAGWPVGDYRVELSIDGKSAGVARFKIEK